VLLPNDGAEEGTVGGRTAVVGDVGDVHIVAMEHRIREMLGEEGETRGHGAPRTIVGPWIHGAGA
jgi:hypothetical protein